MKRRTTRVTVQLIAVQLAIVLVEAHVGHAQTFTTSNLPIVKVNTNGQTINDEPGVVVNFGIIDNASGINSISDSAAGYDGKAKIEFRGCSSQKLPKKPYGIELRSSVNQTESINVPLLGLPSESDWVLNPSYTDKTFIRDPLTFYMANASGHYASRTKYVELVVNGSYQGVYIFQERIKRDKNRVDIKKLDPSSITPPKISGGYIVKIDKLCGNVDPNHVWQSLHDSPGFTRPHLWITHYPNDNDLTTEQFTYIKNYINDFENVMASPAFGDELTGYPAYIDENSFINYALLQEVTSNSDAYRISTYFAKQRNDEGGKLLAGPAWDFNLAYGSLTTPLPGTLQTYEGWRYSSSGDEFAIPFWWKKLLTDSRYSNKLINRYRQLRQTVWKTDSLVNFINAQYARLDQGALGRNFIKWPIIGVSVWNDDPSYVGATLADEINHLKLWLRNRLAWLDASIMTLSDPASLADLSISLTANRRAMHRGEPVQFSLAVTNSGPATARRIQVQHRLPPQTEFAGSSSLEVSVATGAILIDTDTLGSNQTVVFKYELRHNQPGKYIHLAQVTASSVPDPDSQPDSGTEDGQDDATQLDLRTPNAGTALFVSPNPNQTPLPPVQSSQPPTEPNTADLSLSLTSSTLIPTAGQPVALSLTVSNRGGAAASNISVATLLPTGWQLVNSAGLSVNGQTVTGSLPSISAGSSGTLVLTVQTTSAGTVKAQIQTTSPTDPDSTPGNGYDNGEDDEASLTVRVP